MGLLWFCQSAHADLISDVTVVNVTPTSFSVVWQATNSTPSIAIFADAGGVTNLAGQVGVEIFPLHTGNPDLAAGYQRRMDAATLRQKTQSYGLMMVRVSGCHPGTTYYFRLTSTPTIGSPETYPASVPLPDVTTATENTFVANDQAIILDIPGSNNEGGIVLLTHTNAAYPLAAIIGDGAGTNQVFFNVSDLFAATGTGNFTPLGDQDFAVDILGSDQAFPSQTYTLTFTADFTTTLTTLLTVNDEFLTIDVGSTVLRDGQTGGVSIISDANTNLSSIDLTLQIPSGRLTNLVLQSLAPQLDPAATAISRQSSSAWLLHFAALSGQTLVGSNALAVFTFTAVSNQTSAFVPLRVITLDGTKTNASAISRTFAQSGRVVIVGNQPLLEAGFAPDGSRRLTLYGKAWMSYAIEYSTNLSNPIVWNQARHFAQTNMVTVLTGFGNSTPNIFYRALEFTPDPPVLDGFLSANGSRTLLSYGQPGFQYTVLTKTNLSNIVPWTAVQTYTLTNSFQYFNPTGGNHIIFYRLQKN